MLSVNTLFPAHVLSGFMVKRYMYRFNQLWTMKRIYTVCIEGSDRGENPGLNPGRSVSYHQRIHSTMLAPYTLMTYANLNPKYIPEHSVCYWSHHVCFWRFHQHNTIGTGGELTEHEISRDSGTGGEWRSMKMTRGIPELTCYWTSIKIYSVWL